MSWDNKVLWTEGLFLQPQHFQQSDRYVESLINGLARRIPTYAWGLSEFEIDEEILKVGQFSLKACSGLTADGTLECQVQTTILSH
jgi:type VI secretion system protein ImpJ